MKKYMWRRICRSWLLLPEMAGVAMIVLGAGIAQAATSVSCGDVLNTPGSYILIGNLNCIDTAVTITASNVRLDLAGFTITGSGTGDGIRVTGPVSRVRIRDGTVTSFNNGLAFTNVTDSTVTSLIATGNGDGVQLLDSGNNTFRTNTVTGNVAGVRLTNSNFNRFLMNSVTLNVPSSSSTVGFGFFLSSSDGNVINSNNVSGNGDVGIQIQDGSDNNVVLKNNASDTLNADSTQGRGIVVVASAGTVVDGNTTNSGQAGIFIGVGATGSLIQKNTAKQNSGSGISLSGATGNTVANNIAGLNTFAGILLDNGAAGNTIQDNTANQNSQFGIVLIGATGNTIEGNTALGNSTFDLADTSSDPCIDNTWSNNIFVTDNELDGPGTGCIQ